MVLIFITNELLQDINYTEIILKVKDAASLHNRQKCKVQINIYLLYYKFHTLIATDTSICRQI